MNKDLRFTFFEGLTEWVLSRTVSSWKDMKATVERSTNYYGSFATYSVNVKFVFEGATLLRSIFYEGWNGRQIYLKVEKLEKKTQTYGIYDIYKIDFTSFVDINNEVSVNCTGGLLAGILKRNETKTYTLTGVTCVHNLNGYYDEYGALSCIMTKYELIDIITALFELATEGAYSGGLVGLDTSYFDQFTGHLVIAKRTLTGDSGPVDQSVKTSFKDFWDSLNAIQPIAIKITKVAGIDTLYFCDRADVYDSDTIIETVTIGETIQMQIAEDYRMRTLICGYATQEYTEADSKKYEFACKSEWDVPNSDSDKTYDITCKYRADSFGMKEAFFGDTTAESDDLWFVWMRTEIWGIVAGADTVTNTMSSVKGCFNGHLSPKRNMWRHRFWISDMAYPITPTWSMVSSDLGLQLITLHVNNISGGSDPSNTYEYVSIPIEAPSIFKPVSFQFSAIGSKQLYTNILANPYGCLQFEYRGNTYKGYILKAVMNAAGMQKVDLTLLSTADNDLTKLIR